jgi:serine/threonine protein kinase
VKIGDFGFSKEFGTPNKKYTPEVCTKQFRAPELFFGTNYYTEKTDIWSLGCIFYYIFTKSVLFDTYNASDIDILARIFALTGTPNVP